MEQVTSAANITSKFGRHNRGSTIFIAVTATLFVLTTIVEHWTNFGGFIALVVVINLFEAGFAPAVLP